jgi:hypothetical protein
MGILFVCFNLKRVYKGMKNKPSNFRKFYPTDQKELATSVLAPTASIPGLTAATTPSSKNPIHAQAEALPSWQYMCRHDMRV